MLLYSYQWYSTGHIHQLSIKDFRKTVADLGLAVKDSAYLFGRFNLPKYICPNILATEAILLLEKK